MDQSNRDIFDRLSHSARIWLVAACLLAMGGCGIFDKDDDATAPTELTDIEATVQLQELWSLRVGDGNGDKYTSLAPALHGEMLYIADAGGKVLAIERATGQAAWSADLDVRVSGGVGVGHGLVVVGGSDGDVYALDAVSGDLRWTQKVSSEVLARPLVSEGQVVVQSMDDNLHAFTLAEGTSKWVYDNEVPILTLRGTSAPLLFEDLVVAGFANGKLAGIDVSNGQLRWEYRVGMPRGESELERMVDIDGDLVADGDTVYVASFQGRVSAVHASTGVSRWDREASSYRGVGVGAHRLYMANAEGLVEAMDRHSSDVVWEQEGLRYRRLTAPAVLGSYILVGDFEGYLHVLSGTDGAMVGRTRVDDSGLRSRMLVADDVLYVMANNGRVTAYQVN